jgi:membrane-associated protease RseP (regulator of RpoE activity)
MRLLAFTFAALTVACLLGPAAVRAGTEEPRPPATSAPATAPAPAAPARAAGAVDAVIRRLDAQVVLDQPDAQKKALEFIGASKAHAEAVLNLQQCQTCHQNPHDHLKAVFGLDTPHMIVAGPDTPWVGVSVGPADEVLRSQLKLPEGTGVVVTQVVPDGPAQKADVREHDILLSVNGQPVPDGDALDAVVKAAKPDAPPLALKLLRDGQPVERQVAPSREPRQYLSELSNVLRVGNPYRIGVSVSEPDETLRKQLRLDDAGLVVTAVAENSPAAKQGVKVNDVLVSANGRAMKGDGDLPEVVRGAAKSPVELELVRGGVRLKIAVTPEKDESAAVNLFLTTRLAESMPNQELTLIQPGLIKYSDISVPRLGEPAAQTQPQRDGSSVERLDKIAEQLEQLRAAVEALRADVVKQAPSLPNPK